MQYLLRGNYEAALRQLDGAKSGGSSPAEVENVRGLALLLEGKPAEARAAFDRALQLQPELQAARYNRALALLRSNENARAIADLEIVWKDEHAAVRPDAAYHLGIAHDRLGRPSEAEAWLDRAIRLDPELGGAMLYLGLLRERRGDLQGAGRAYLEHLQANPSSVVAMLRFGIAAQKAGKIEVAKDYLRRVLTIAPSSDEAMEARKYLVMWEE